MYLTELLELLPADEKVVIKTETQVELFKASEHLEFYSQGFQFTPVTEIIPNGYTDALGISYLTISIIEPAFK